MKSVRKCCDQICVAQHCFWSRFPSLPLSAQLYSIFSSVYLFVKLVLLFIVRMYRVFLCLYLVDENWVGFWRVWDCLHVVLSGDLFFC